MNTELLDVLKYNSLTGDFIWLKQVSNKFKGSTAGCITDKGYIRIGYKGKYYAAHRLAFFFMGKDIPKQVDHDNHITTDNRWVNLIPTTSVLNARNASKSKINTSGFTGVSWNSNKKRWMAGIRVNYKKINLGAFIHKQDAIDARVKANKDHGFNKNHGT